MKRKPIALVLAAGKGTRFKSNLIKILHPLLGKPMVSHVLEMLRSLGIEDVLVVVGYQKERVIEALQEEGVQFVVQAEQLGTAHAVLAARDKLASFLDRDLLIINGDLPILRAESLQPLIETHFQAGNAL
ncbi:MAG: bifunctional N-acetylglucosamine-1-phosphate uridyltransferase/glucosamine-1-phosphate acetyltransferase, partial [Candidatus Aminicenantes bacterium 4484_214]